MKILKSAAAATAGLATIISSVIAAEHPLAAHMHHWLNGNGEWRTPNPGYDADAAAGTAGAVKEFGVVWRWSEFDQYLVGELNGVLANGGTIKFWDMYHFYNPVTNVVTFTQVGRRGDLITGEEPLRVTPTDYGEPELLITEHFAPSGTVLTARHENTFVDADTQHSDVYRQDDDGNWSLTAQWLWKRINTAPESEAE